MNNQQAVRNTVLNVIRGWRGQGRAFSTNLAAVPPSSSVPKAATPGAQAPAHAQPHVASRGVQIQHAPPHNANMDQQQQPLQGHTHGTAPGHSNSAARSCANCTSQDEKVSEGFIHINDFIAEKYPELQSFDPDVVKPLLQEHLSWKVIDVGSLPF
jgi:hypothetical protein